MNIDDCYLLGYIVKVHGTKGGVVIYLDTDKPEEYYQMESVFVQQNSQLIPFFIDGFEQTNKPERLITHFEGIDSVEDAEKIKGLSLYLPLSVLPDLGDNHFYYHEIIGFKIVDENLGELGTLKTIYELPANEMMVLDIQGKEIMIPFAEPIYKGVDKNNGIIKIWLPEDYLEVFLSDPNQKEDEV